MSTGSSYVPRPFLLRKLTSISPDMRLRGRSYGEVQSDYLAGQGCLCNQQDPVRPPPDNHSAQHWDPGKCHNYNRRYLCVAPRTKYSAEGDSKVERYTARLLRPL